MSAMSMGSSSAAEYHWDAENVLDFYIHDYMLRKKYEVSAKTFLIERKVLPMSVPPASEAVDGFLPEWWSIFTDIYFPHIGRRQCELEASAPETQLQFSEQHRQQNKHANHQMLCNQEGKPKDLDGYLAVHRSDLSSGCKTDVLLCNQGTAHATASRMFEEQFKLAKQRDVDMRRLLSYEATSSPGPSPVFPRHVVDHVHWSSLSSRQSSGPGGTLSRTENSRVNPVSPRYVGGDCHNNSQLVSQWSVRGNDNSAPHHLSSPQISRVQSPLHHQSDWPHQQLFLNAPVLTKWSGTPSSEDVTGEDSGACTQKTDPGPPGEKSKDVSRYTQPTNQVACPSFKGTQEKDILMRMKQLARLHGQPRTAPLRQKQRKAIQEVNHKAMGASAVEAKGTVPAPHDIPTLSNLVNRENLFTGLIDCRKRKEHNTLLSDEHANITEATNTGGPSPTSADEWTQAPALQPSSRNAIAANMVEILYESDSLAMESPFARWDELLLEESGALEYDMEPFLSYVGADSGETAFENVASKETLEHNFDASEIFSLIEVGCLQPSGSKVTCCHFSTDGNLLATGGADKKVHLWNVERAKIYCTLEKHTSTVTDVRFSPNSALLATSSIDKTVQVWDARTPTYSLLSLEEHVAPVQSIDFHPNKEDLLFSCDENGGMKCWNLSKDICSRNFKGGKFMRQIRFQPQVARYLAAAAENEVNIFDVESATCLKSLRGHTTPVLSICWGTDGENMASVSEDSVKIWAFGATNGGMCVHELNYNGKGNRFWSCIFHPLYPSILVIGCCQSFELWDIRQNKTVTVPAHNGLVAALTHCSTTSMLASASHDSYVKLWK